MRGDEDVDIGLSENVVQIGGGILLPEYVHGQLRLIDEYQGVGLHEEQEAVKKQEHVFFAG
jgi:hypothetical protein